MAETIDKIRDIVRKVGALGYCVADDQPLFHSPADETAEHAQARTDFGLDSLDRVEILMRCEEEFDVDITDDVAGGLNTINDIAGALRDRGVE